MSDRQGGEPSGLFSALKNIVATLLATGRTRLELLGNEIEEEKLRLIRLVVLMVGMAFCFSIGILLAIVLLAVLFWESRALVFATTAILFLGLGAILYGMFKRTTLRPEQVFAASITELQEDIRQLRAALGHDAPPE